MNWKLASEFPEDELRSILKVMPKAHRLSGYDGAVRLKRGRRDSLRGDGEGAAITRWWPFSSPVMTLFDAAFDDEDYLGITLTHELIHCRQGGFRVMWENFLWTLYDVLGVYRGEVPIEEEAEEAVNMWWDDHES
jgi:hypothetical protein